MVSYTDTPKVLFTLEYSQKGTDRTVPFVPLFEGVEQFYFGRPEGFIGGFQDEGDVV